MRAMSSSVSSRWVRSTMRPSVRASMNSTSPRRSRNLPSRRSRARNHRQAGSGSSRRAGPATPPCSPPSPPRRGSSGSRPRPTGRTTSSRWRARSQPRPPVPSDARCAAPTQVGVARRRDAIPPALVVRQPLAAPVRDVERRIGEDEVRSQVGVAVVVEGVAVCDLALDAADGEVHPGEPPRGVVRLLAVDGDVAPRPAAVPVAGGVRADELHRLHEHPRRAAAGVVDPPPPGLQHLDQELDDAARGVELAALLALGARELREEVLVDAAEHVLGAGVRVAHPDVADHVDELAEPLLVERRAGVVLGQHVLERRSCRARSRSSRHPRAGR